MERRKLRMGMVGGGQGAFIGAIHRMAANLDGQIELVCGAFSSNYEKCIETGKELYIPSDRCYATFQEMIDKEATLPEEQRMDFVSIVTPNHLHFEPAKKALETGFPVIIDKPISFTTEEAKKLKVLVEQTKLPFALTYTYSGYPMVKQAKGMIRNNTIGSITKVTVEYPQGWLTEKIEDQSQKQASWRTDPKRSGKSGSYGDIGTHAANLTEYVSGLKIKKVLSRLSKVVDGRLLDDDATVLLEFEGGIPGILNASQVSAGEENDLKIRVYGKKGSLEWSHKDNNSLLVKWLDKPNQIYRAGGDNSYLLPEALAHLRTPSGHPEGYLEAFANIYRNFAYAITAVKNNKNIDPLFDFPSVDDGLHGMILIDAVVNSSENGNTWITIEE